MAYTTKDRQDTLARTRRKRAQFIHAKPHWLTAIRDTAVVIDALEALVILDMKGTHYAKKEETEGQDKKPTKEKA